MKCQQSSLRKFDPKRYRDKARNYAEMTERYPNLYLIGAPKCGTTSIYKYLSSHPDIYASDWKKEPNFFNVDLTKGVTGIRSAEKYSSLYLDWDKEKYALDASVWYLLSKVAPKLIHQADPSAKIVVSLRSPSIQMVSLHAQRYVGGNEDIEDPEKAFQAESERRGGGRIPRGVHVEDGLLYSEVANYPPQLRRYFDVFGRTGVYVIIFEEFIGEPKAEFAKLCRFLDIEPIQPPSFDVHNAYKVPRMRSLPAIARSLRSASLLRRIIRTCIPSYRLRVQIGEYIMRANYKYVSKPNTEIRLDPELAMKVSHIVEETEELLGRELPWER
jgi:hypothetical protein